MLLTLIFDFLIKLEIIDPLLYIHNDFASSIFSGILTFSTLSQTVLSVIVSVIDTKIYGLKLREILSFNATPIKFIHYIIFSMLLTLSSIVALSFELFTLISTIAIITVLYNNIISIIIFRIISDVTFCKKIVILEIENNKDNNEFLCNHIINWLNEYKAAIKINNNIEIKLYADILKKCTEHVDTLIIKNSLQDMFDIACKNHSVAEAIYLTFDSIGLSSSILDICKKSIKAITYLEDSEILQIDIPSAINSILSSNYLPYNKKVDLSLFYFEAIIYSRMTSEEKIKLLNIAIDEITNITEDEIGLIKSDVIYRILINDIILSDDEINSDLYEVLMKSLHCNNLASKNPLLIATMAKILRGLYFYSTLSIKLFNETKRDKIALIAKSNFMVDWLSEVSLKRWISRFRDEFLIFYLQDAFEDEYIPYDKFKTNVMIIENGEQMLLWQPNNKLKFALWYYFSFAANNKDFPIYECTNKVSKWQDYHQEYSMTLLKEFQNNSFSLTSSCISHIDALYGFNTEHIPLYSLSDERLKKTYKNITSFIEAQDKLLHSANLD